jgi:anthranilate synthase/aminodeoxychorismate synthase-like glutamine amidotransferase
MLLLIDNYDSFSYNLVQALAVLGAEVKIVRNDDISVADAVAAGPAAVVISPGPCTPKEAGISVELIKRLSGEVPILGVCLGHQSVAAAFGAEIVHAEQIMHGKTSMVRHEGGALYKGMDNPFVAGRYHSLAVQQASVPEDLVPDAWSEDGEIMGFHHRTHPTCGVQFHPESVLTPAGNKLLENFLTMAAQFGQQPT